MSGSTGSVTSSDLQPWIDQELFRSFFMPMLSHHMDLIAQKLNVEEEKIYLNAAALASAVKAINFDLEFIRIRRGLEGGVSLGKLAGVIYFRLLRHNVISMNPYYSEEQGSEQWYQLAQYLPELVGLNFVVTSVLKIDLSKAAQNRPQDTQLRSILGESKASPNISVELVFLLKNRHFNQETLAFIFDGLRILDNWHRYYAVNYPSSA